MLASLHSQCSSFPLIQFLRLLTVSVLADAFPAQPFISVLRVWALPLPSIPVFHHLPSEQNKVLPLNLFQDGLYVLKDEDHSADGISYHLTYGVGWFCLISPVQFSVC